MGTSILPETTDTPTTAPDSRAYKRGETRTQLRSEEDRLQQLQSTLLASVSQEFLTPLSALLASVEFLRDEVPHLTKRDIEEILNSVHYSVTNLQNLISNLLESANIAAGRFHIRQHSVNIELIIQDAIHVMEPFVIRRQQQLVVFNPGGEVFVTGDRARLTHAMVNLLCNAIKYGPLGQKIEITIETKSDSHLLVSVFDQGSGIPESELGRLFKPYQYIEPCNGVQHGLGLGLSVVKAIIEEHGGEVGVIRQNQKGTTFWFKLPVVAQQDFTNNPTNNRNHN